MLDDYKVGDIVKIDYSGAITNEFRELLQGTAVKILSVEVAEVKVFPVNIGTQQLYTALGGIGTGWYVEIRYLRPYKEGDDVG